MKLNYKKMSKFAMLLILSAIIATVSASTYYSMFMTANIGVSGENKIFFTPGNDWGSSTMGDGNQTVTLSLTGRNGTATVVGDPVRIRNTDTVSHDINLKLDSWNGESQTQLNYINITLYNSYPIGGTAQGTTIYLVPGAGDVTETTTVSLTNGAIWRVQWIIYWKSTASSETVVVNLKLEITS